MSAPQQILQVMAQGQNIEIKKRKSQSKSEISGMTSKDVLAALQDFRTDFELAKAAAPPYTGSSSSKESDVKLENVKQPPVLEVPTILLGYLQEVSKSGLTTHPWKVIKPLILCKLDEVVRWYNRKQPLDNLPTLPNSAEKKFKSLHALLISTADSFKQAPFTIQRLCELLCFPEQHYKKINKFLHALEKNLSVVTTVDTESRKICESSDADVTGSDDNQQTHKVLALFDWINSVNESTDQVSGSNGTSDRQESQSLDTSTSAEPISADPGPSVPAPVVSNSSVPDTITSTDMNASLTSQTENKSMKRSLSDDDDKDAATSSGDAKRIKVDEQTTAELNVHVNEVENKDVAGDIPTVVEESNSIEVNKSSVSLSSSSEEVYPSSSNEDNTSCDGDSLCDSDATEATSGLDLPVDKVGDETGALKGDTAPASEPATKATSDAGSTGNTDSTPDSTSDSERVSPQKKVETASMDTSAVTTTEATKSDQEQTNQPTAGDASTVNSNQTEDDKKMTVE